ncbi:MAG: GNAT family N-acetyltransferase [Saprospiraceae bacterium]
MENKNKTSIPELTTERLILRQLLDTDVQEIFLLRSDPVINKYLDRPPCKSLDDASKFIDKIKNNGTLYWAISLKEHEKLIGTICLFDISEELKKGEIGYELLPEFQGKGIMNEATKKIMEYALHPLGLTTINAFTHKDNKPSISLLIKLKFENQHARGEINDDMVLFQFQEKS